MNCNVKPGNPTIVNLVICIVDYLLRLQESIMDFYWYYSRKELIDPAGQANFFTAIGVASQVFNTITEIIQVRIVLWTIEVVYIVIM